MIMLSKNKAPIQLLESLHALTVRRLFFSKTNVLLLHKMGIDSISISYITGTLQTFPNTQMKLSNI